MTTQKTTRKTRTPAGTAAIKTKKIVKRVKLPPNPFIHEILNLVEEQKTKAKKIDILREYRDDSLTAILIWNFDDSVVSAIPEGQVPYKENEVPVGTDHTSLRREWKNLFHFIKGGNDSLSALRRETMFIQMLEGLHPEEAKIICLVKDKNLNETYNLTQDIIAEAFPDIRWSDRAGQLKLRNQWLHLHGIRKKKMLLQNMDVNYLSKMPVKRN